MLTPDITPQSKQGEYAKINTTALLLTGPLPLLRYFNTEHQFFLHVLHGGSHPLWG